MMKRNVIVSVSFFLLSLCGVRGDSFVHLDWSRFLTDGMLPETATRFELGRHYADISSFPDSRFLMVISLFKVAFDNWIILLCLLLAKSIVYSLISLEKYKTLGNNSGLKTILV